MLRLFTSLLKTFLLPFLLLTNHLGLSQPSDSITYKKVALDIQGLYNQKQFGDIYAMTASSFQDEIKKEAFVGFMEKGIYYGLADMNSQIYEGSHKEHHTFTCNFKNGKLSMNLILDETKKITYLQFLPYKELKKTKILNFLSDNKKQTALDSVVDAAVLNFIQSPENCGISIGIQKNGITYFYNYGETKRNNSTLPNPQTIYEIGSVTKTFCGLLLAIAVNEKKINLDDEIRGYLPGKYPNLPKGKNAICIKHLANHTSGLPRIPEDMMSAKDIDSLNPYKNYSRQMMLDYLKKVKIEGSVGTTCDYSNYGMALLGLILEEVYKKSFEELVKEKICTPNKMMNTTVKITEAQNKNFAQGYNTEGMETPHWDLVAMAAAGALRSTTEDMLLYLNYNLKETDEATKLAHTITFSDRQNVALAWFVTKTKSNNTLTWHNGGTYGFASFCGFIKETDCSVVVLSNSSTNVDYIAIALLRYLQK